MTDLDHLLAELPIEPAPLDELVVRGHHRRLRRRLAGAAALGAVVVVAGGIALLGGSGSPGGRAVDPAGAGGGSDPAVRIVGTASPEFERMYAELSGAEPFWEAETESVYYVSAPAFSGSCPPVGTVSTAAGAMTLSLAADPADQACTADAGPVIAVVEHVPVKPDELTISDISTQRTLPLLEGHPVVVHTELVGPEVFYIEGARVQTSLRTEVGVERTAVGEVGAMTTFRGVPEGRSRLTGATLVCSGSCDALSEPTDTCEEPVDVDGAVEAVVTLRWGSPCEVTVP